MKLNNMKNIIFALVGCLGVAQGHLRGLESANTTSVSSGNRTLMEHENVFLEEDNPDLLLQSLTERNLQSGDGELRVRRGGGGGRAFPRFDFSPGDSIQLSTGKVVDAIFLLRRGMRR